MKHESGPEVSSPRGHLPPLPDLDSVIPLSTVDPAGAESEFEEALSGARVYLTRQRSLGAIQEEYFGDGLPGIVSVFLFKIEPSEPSVGPWVWVIVGDLPPDHVTGDDHRTPAEALNGYIKLMEEWVKGVRTGNAVTELPRGAVAPTAEHADMLEGRLRFLKKNILPLFEDEDWEPGQIFGDDGGGDEYLPDFSSVTPLSPENPPGQDAEFKDMHKRARQYLGGHKWVTAIEEEYLGAAVSGIIYIFLFKIHPGRPDVDEWRWVIVGDVPPAYMTCDRCKNPAEALERYIGAMEEWVEAARAGKPVDQFIPVNVPPTRENAEMLAGRLQFLDEKVLPTLVDEDEAEDDDTAGEEAESIEETPYDDQPDLNTVTALTSRHPLAQDVACKEAHQQARDLLRSQGQMPEVEAEYLGAAVKGIVYIFLFKIRTADDDEDIPWLWVIVGDIPPAEMTCFSGTTPAEVLKAYIGAMTEWVKVSCKENRSKDSFR